MFHLKKYATFIQFFLIETSIICMKSPIIDGSKQQGITVSAQIHYACVGGNTKRLKALYKKYGMEIFNNPVELPDRSNEYPLVLSIYYKQWDIADMLIKWNVNTNVSAEFGESVFHIGAETQDNSEKKVSILDALIKKKANINDNLLLNNKPPFYRYVYKNRANINHNDPVLAFFIEKKVDISGTCMLNEGLHNNIIYNTIEACELNVDDIVRIIKSIFSCILKPLDHKLVTLFCCFKYFNKKNPVYKVPTPLRLLITTAMMRYEPEVQEIVCSLTQIKENYLPFNYFIYYLTLKSGFETEKKIFDSFSWKEDPVKQRILCAPLQKK